MDELHEKEEALMKRASIDIGSNSVQFIIAQIYPEYKVLCREQFITGLGRQLDQTKVFSSVAMEETFQALRECVKLAKDNLFDPSNILATATEAARVAKNSKEFFNKIKDQLGISINLITSEAEAYFSSKGLIFNSKFNEDELFVMDIGGASTELIHVSLKPFKIIKTISLPLGSVRMCNWEQNGEKQSRLIQLDEKFHDAIVNFKTEKLYCVAGTMTSVGNIFLENKNFSEDEVNNLSLTYLQFAQTHGKISDLSTDTLSSQYPFLGKRVEVIKSGFNVADYIFKHIEVKHIVICTQGLMHGLISEGFIPEKYLFKSE